MEEGVFTESINYAALKNLPILFACEDNELAIHSKKNARTPNTSYEKRISAYGIKTSSYSYENPNDLLKGVNHAFEKVRNSEPHFLIVKCYRWMEHVGVGHDWDLGYRNKDDLIFWKKFDIETNPGIFGFSSKEINEINIKVKKIIEEIFINSHNKKDADEDSLLKNVY